MNAYSIAAPEDIAKKYGGNKKKIQQAASQGLISPTEAVMAGMFIDRIRKAAQAEQAQQPTVAEQVMNPQPQMPPQGMAAMPQAQQMPPQAQMGQPQMPPQQMAMGGGLDSIPYNEGDYAEGGIVSFNRGDAVRAEFEALGRRRDDLKQALVELENRPFYIGSEKQNLQNQLAAVERKIAQGPSFAETPIEPVERNYPDVQQAPGQLGFQLPAAPAAPAAPRSDSTQYPADTVSGRQYPDVQQTPGQLSFELPGPKGSPTETNAYTSGSGLAGTSVAQDFGVDAVPLTSAQQEMADQQLRLSERRKNAPTFMDMVNSATKFAKETLGGRNVVGSDDYIQAQGGTDMNALDRIAAEKTASAPVIMEDPLAMGGAETVGSGKGFVETLSGGLRSLFADDTPAAEQQATPSGVQDRRGTLAEQVARMRQGEEPKETAAKTETQQTTLADQVKEVNKTTEDLKPKTVEKDDSAAAKTALDAANDQADAMTKAAQNTADDEFTKRIEELMDPAAKGEFRKETEALVKNREERLKSAKKEAFSMALLQAGLGMLGQGGGQTALQALGKAALPATKDYAAAIKDAKKEDRELLQLGLSMEQMDAKELAATKRVVAQLHGDRAKAMLSSATSMANNVRSTAATKYSADASERVGMAKAAAMESQAKNQSQLTGALKVQGLIDQVGKEIGEVRAEAREALSGDSSLQLLNAQLAKAQKDQDTQRMDDLNLAIRARERQIYDSKGYTSQLDGLKARQNELYDLFSSLDAGSGFTVKRVK